MCSSGTAPVSPMVTTGFVSIKDDGGVFMDAHPDSATIGAKSNVVAMAFMVVPIIERFVQEGLAKCKSKRISASTGETVAEGGFPGKRQGKGTKVGFRSSVLDG